MNDDVLSAIVVWQAIGSGVLCAAMACAKGRSALAWAFVGLVFGILAVIALAGMPIREEEEQETSFVCPSCRHRFRRLHRIDQKALCPKCGEQF